MKICVQSKRPINLKPSEEYFVRYQPMCSFYIKVHNDIPTKKRISFRSTIFRVYVTVLQGIFRIWISASGLNLQWFTERISYLKLQYVTYMHTASGHLPITESTNFQPGNFAFMLHDGNYMLVIYQKYFGLPLRELIEKRQTFYDRMIQHFYGPCIFHKRNY